jgi:hypothetical protein
MKSIRFSLMILGMMTATAVFAVQVIDINFGEVAQGQSRNLSFEVNANDIDATIAGDTPFEVQMPSPFTVQPVSGTLRRFTKTTITVTLPANAPFGVHDKRFKVILHKQNSNPFIDPPVRATVIGFPYQLTPSSILDLGNQSQANLKIKNLSISTERVRISARDFTVSDIAPQINPGGTVQIVVSVPEALQGQPAFQEQIKLTDDRSDQERTLLVKANPGNAKPDLLTTIQAVKVFPRAAGQTETNIQVTFNVKNVGFAASKPCKTKVSIDNDKVLELATAPIATGSSAPPVTQSFKTAKTGSHTLKVKVDFDDQNNEPDENNNDATKDIDIP